jgi:hypothetical protein
MSTYKLKPGKIGEAVINTYKKVEQNFTEKFLEKDETNESGFSTKPSKIEKTVVEGYKKVENGVTQGYKKIEKGVVDSYKTIETKFVEKHLEPVDESSDADNQEN